jgi:hypothetical protein
MAAPLPLPSSLLLLLLLVLLSFSLNGVLGSACPTRLQADVVLGDRSSTYARLPSIATAAGCCALCGGNASCAAWTFEAEEATCYLKTSAEPATGKAGAVSGAMSTAGSTRVSLALDQLLFTTLPTFKSWNIDASANRQFFTRDLNNSELHYLARMSMPGLLRFGGTGNDFLIYGFGNTTCDASQTCLNQTWFRNLMDLARDAGVPVIFGLNLMQRTPPAANGSTQWDPTNARELITFAIQQGYTFFGFELGNEQNDRFSPQQEAHDFHLLDLLLTELYPDPSQRPKVRLAGAPSLVPRSTGMARGWWARLLG